LLNVLLQRWPDGVTGAIATEARAAADASVPLWRRTPQSHGGGLLCCGLCPILSVRWTGGILGWTCRLCVLRPSVFLHLDVFALGPLVTVWLNPFTSRSSDPCSQLRPAGVPSSPSSTARTGWEDRPYHP
jgi:hypothetical protein